LMVLFLVCGGRGGEAELGKVWLVPPAHMDTCVRHRFTAVLPARRREAICGG
jgi:hypothetical protein